MVRETLASDERVNDFLDRPLSGEWPYLWLDATYLKVRQGGRIVSVAAIIAVAVNTAPILWRMP
jgi:transposase-like protein